MSDNTLKLESDNQSIVLIDASYSRTADVGIGAWLFIDNLHKTKNLDGSSIKFKKFRKTSSSKLELENLINALTAINSQNLTVFTDSQLLVGLPKRRKRLEKDDFRNGKGELLALHSYFRKLFAFMDERKLRFRKIKGHQKKDNKSNLERLFTLVDKAARKRLREEVALMQKVENPL